MAKVILPVTFVACGAIRSYLVPVTGNYLISAAGAEGGAGAAAGGKGAFAQGMFYLRQGDVLHVVIGQQGGASRADIFGPDHPTCGGGGGGGSFIWKGTRNGLMPAWPLLVAGGGGGGGSETGGDGRAGPETSAGAESGSSEANGHGGVTDPCCHFGGGGGVGWLGAGANGPGPVYCGGGTHWLGADGIGYGPMAGGDGGFGGGGGGGFLGYAAGGGGGFAGGGGGGQVESQLPRVRRSGGGSSYNAGLNPINLPGYHSGHGRATITAVVTPVVLQTTRPATNGFSTPASALPSERPA